MLWNRFRGDSNSLGENQGSALTPSANNPSGKDSVLNPHSNGLTAYEKKDSLANDKSMDTATTSLGGDTALSQTKESAVKQADREDGQLLILPSNKEEVGVLSAPTANLSAAKIDNSSETAKEYGGNLSVEDKIKAVSQQFEVDEADVAMYANAIKKGEKNVKVKTAYEKKDSLANDKSTDTATTSLGGDTALSQTKESAAKASRP